MTPFEALVMGLAAGWWLYEAGKYYSEFPPAWWRNRKR